MFYYIYAVGREGDETEMVRNKRITPGPVSTLETILMSQIFTPMSENSLKKELHRHITTENELNPFSDNCKKRTVTCNYSNSACD